MSFTNSSLKTFRQCPRKYYIKYECGIGKVSTSPSFLRIGSAIHAALENYLISSNKNKGTEALEQSLRAEWCLAEDSEIRDTIMYEMPYVTAMYNYYIDRWQNHPLETSKTEVQLSHQGVFIKCDGIGKMPESMMMPERMVNIEHKTVSKAIDITDYTTNLLLDSQVNIYTDILRKCGYPILTTLYDIIVKPPFKVKNIAITDEDGIPIITDESGERVRNKNGSWKTMPNSTKGWIAKERRETHNEFYLRILSELSDENYVRLEVTRTEEQLEATREEMLDTILDIYGCQDRGFWRRNTENCLNHFGGRCPYYHLCCADRTDFTYPPEGFEKLANPHVELDLDNEGNLITGEQL